MNKPWIHVRELAPMLGVTYETAKNKIALGTFEVPTYKLGKNPVADRAVVEAFFEARRVEGLSRLRESTKR